MFTGGENQTEKFLALCLLLYQVRRQRRVDDKRRLQLRDLQWFCCTLRLRVLHTIQVVLSPDPTVMHEPEAALTCEETCASLGSCDTFECVRAQIHHHHHHPHSVKQIAQQQQLTSDFRWVVVDTPLPRPTQPAVSATRCLRAGVRAVHIRVFVYLSS